MLSLRAYIDFEGLNKEHCQMTHFYDKVIVILVTRRVKG